MTDFDFQLIKTDKKEQGKIKKQFSKTEIDIIIFLTNHPDSSPEDIQNSVKGTLKTIQNYLSPLKSKGFLTDKIDGKCKLWSISDEKHFEIKQIIDKGYYDEDEND